MKKLKFCLLLFSLIGISNQSEAQLKQFQKWYVGGSWGFSYVPLEGYNDHNSRDVLNSNIIFNSNIKPFDLIDKFPVFSGEIIFRDSKDLGLRAFADYYSTNVETKSESGKSTYTRSVSSFDIGVQVLWFLTQDYTGPQLILGFGGAIMLPLIEEKNDLPPGYTDYDFKFDNISGGAHFSLIGMVPVYQKWFFKFEGCYRFSRSSTFFEVDDNHPLNADVELTGFIGKVGFLYEF